MCHSPYPSEHLDYSISFHFLQSLQISIGTGLIVVILLGNLDTVIVYQRY